ncbi:outer mitochondrial transmembrane helix translocase [Gracilinanus agilis]|uniref:outer mitochondrial transmembrane helix translocase n=1 Tax=Gracilinanus agilis TaxID=191870 RepID=UPI001CFCE76F|nr:outer mitochondrial transmembrane helix translocase [Gracilinanus agilis]
MVHAEAFSRPLSRNEVVGLIFRLTIFGAVTYFTIKWMVDAIDPTRKQKVEAQKQAEKLMKQIGVKNVKLSEYEMSIAAHLVDPLNMHVTWSDIAGLDDVITDLKDTVILPIKKKHLFENSRLLQPPKGVLLYGPPGCGKTLIAKATAKEAGCRFINLQPSTLTDKWYGESQKLAAAVFSLAIKLQPSIIFIDEIDSFLRSRSSSDHEATAMMKAQFMSLWDGLDTDYSCQVGAEPGPLPTAPFLRGVGAGRRGLREEGAPRGPPGAALLAELVFAARFPLRAPVFSPSSSGSPFLRPRGRAAFFLLWRQPAGAGPVLGGSCSRGVPRPSGPAPSRRAFPLLHQLPRFLGRFIFLAPSWPRFGQPEEGAAAAPWGVPGAPLCLPRASASPALGLLPPWPAGSLLTA